MSDAEKRLKLFVQRLRSKNGATPPGDEDLLTPDWARRVDHRLDAAERQLKLLNGTLLTALLADIALRLLSLK